MRRVHEVKLSNSQLYEWIKETVCNSNLSVLNCFVVLVTLPVRFMWREFSPKCTKSEEEGKTQVRVEMGRLRNGKGRFFIQFYRINKMYFIFWDTSLGQTPLYDRHLSMTDTSLRQTPLYDRHLSTSDTSLWQTPLYDRYLSTTDTSLRQIPLYDRHLSMTDTSLWQTPLYDRHLSKTDISLRQTPL